jgi:hypothetical protein
VELHSQIDDPIHTPISPQDSDSLSSSSGERRSATKTSPATIPSSRTSVEKDLDAGISSEASLRDAETALCFAKSSPEDNLPWISPADQPTREILEDTDTNMPDSDQAPIITISNRPISILGFQPTFYVQSPVLRKTSPTIFLQNAALLERTLRPISQDDLRQIERLGEVLQGSGSSEDAFRLFRVFVMQKMAQSAGGALCFPLLLRGLGSLAMNAATREHRHEILEMLKCVTPKELKLHSDHAARGCLLYALLGNCLRQEGKLGIAEQFCSLALHSYRLMNSDHRCPAHQAIIVESLALVIEDSGSRDQREIIDSRVYSLRQQRCGRLDSSIMHAVNTHLFNMFQWCHDRLMDAGFMAEMKAIVGTLLHKSRASTQCANFYNTVLFSLLWKRAEEQETPSCTLGDPSPTFVDRPSSLSSLELLCGTMPVESLSAITRMITSDLESFEHPGVFENLVQITSNIGKRGHLRTMEAFLNAHVAPLRGGDRYATPKTSRIMETFTREFMEANFALLLSENAFQDPRIRQNLHRGSFAPSLISTMLSTPHTSWGRLSSSTSFSKRIISQMLKSNGKPEKATSTPRWSGMSSALSMATTASLRLSAHISSKRNSMIIDEPEPYRPTRNISKKNISRPILISTTNAQVFDSPYLGSTHLFDSADDPMDID